MRLLDFFGYLIVALLVVLPFVAGSVAFTFVADAYLVRLLAAILVGIIVFLFGATLFLTWIKFLEPDQMVTRYILGGRYYDTVITSTYGLNKAYIKWQNRTQTDNDPGHAPRVLSVTEGWFGNVAFIPYPLVIGYFFPTGAVSLPIHVGNVFTKDDPLNDDPKLVSDRVRLIVKVTVNIQLAPYLPDFITTLSLIEKEDCDWTRKITFKDDADHEYKGTRLTEPLLRFVQPLVLEAVRTASVDYTWLGEDDINKKKGPFEARVRAVLRQPESPLVQAGLLKELHLNEDGEPVDEQGEVIKDQPGMITAGPAALNEIDIVVERFEFQPFGAEASDLEKASDKPMVARLEARALATQGKGEGDRIKFFADGAGVDNVQIYQGDVVKSTKPTLIGAGESVTDLIARFLGRVPPPGAPPEEKKS